jgi:fumarylpyruvate hydrolase
LNSIFSLLPTTIPVAGQDRAFPVRRVYCVGRNYVAHIREMKEGDERDPPFFFQKPADSVVRDGEPVHYPQHTNDLQYEVELVVAVGRRGRDIPIERALDHVFGYAVGIDMTRRDRQVEARQQSRPWEVGKSFDESAPCGTIYPVETIGHPATGRIALSVNGEVRQAGELKDMIWNVQEIVANLSAQYELFPGDVIYTGTPAGVGPVVPGDVIVAEIEGVGKLTTPIAHPLNQAMEA